MTLPMCFSHWWMVPKAIRRETDEAFRKGDNERHQSACEAAIAAVHERLGGQ